MTTFSCVTQSEMFKLHPYLVNKGAYLVLAILLLMLAIYNAEIIIPRDFRNYVFVVDITQSMNVQDMRIQEQSASRLNYTLNTLDETIKALPCGTKVSIALFANAEIVPLYVPMEICANYSVIHDSLNHIEWRMAWRGSSHLRLGLLDASRMLLFFLEPAQIIFFTDGDEAAPINAITKIDLTPMPGSNGWLLVGVGKPDPSPVPKFNSKNEIIGYWSQYATKVEPSQIVNEESLGKRDDSIATDPKEYYLSALQEGYLKEMANDIEASYVRLDSRDQLLTAISHLPPTGHQQQPVNSGRIFAVLAMLFVIAEYLPARRN